MMAKAGEAMEDNKQPCGHCRKKQTPRSEATIKSMRNRLNRMIGQLRGISVMLEEDRYCGDVLVQIAAVESALQSLGYQILQEHMETCVTEEIQKGNTDVMQEAMELIKRLK